MKFSLLSLALAAASVFAQDDETTTFRLTSTRTTVVTRFSFVTVTRPVITTAVSGPTTIVVDDQSFTATGPTTFTISRCFSTCSDDLPSETSLVIPEPTASPEPTESLQPYDPSNEASALQVGGVAGAVAIAAAVLLV